MSPPISHARPRLFRFPRVSGRIKDIEEDFMVEEIPAYTPCGKGTHTFFWVEKRGISTRQAMQKLADLLGTHPRSMGSAGMKDKYAVTRQWLSAEHVSSEAVQEYDDGSLRILDIQKHSGKLRTGHLRGNRFQIRVRGVRDTAAILSEGPRLAEGVPNYFGDQRFGRDGDNAETAGRWLVDGGRAPRDRFKRKLFVSALQSAAFNAVLGERVERQYIHRVLEGDVLVTERGGIFIDSDLESVQARVDSWEISPTGPMFGASMRRAEQTAHELECRHEQAFRFDAAVYERMGKLGQGTRRSLRIRPHSLSFEPCDDGFVARFSLPKGAYATVVLAELLK